MKNWNYGRYYVFFLIFSSCSSLDYEGVVKLSEDFNGADLRNVCTEAGKTDRASHDYHVTKSSRNVCHTCRA